jgi:hypothetical protein
VPPHTCGARRLTTWTTAVQSAPTGRTTGRGAAQPQLRCALRPRVTLHLLNRRGVPAARATGACPRLAVRVYCRKCWDGPLATARAPLAAGRSSRARAQAAQSTTFSPSQAMKFIALLALAAAPVRSMCSGNWRPRRAACRAPAAFAARRTPCSCAGRPARAAHCLIRRRCGSAAETAHNRRLAARRRAAPRRHRRSRQPARALARGPTLPPGRANWPSFCCLRADAAPRPRLRPTLAANCLTSPPASRACSRSPRCGPNPQVALRRPLRALLGEQRTHMLAVRMTGGYNTSGRLLACAAGVSAAYLGCRRHFAARGAPQCSRRVD